MNVYSCGKWWRYHEMVAKGWDSPENILKLLNALAEHERTKYEYTQAP